MEILIFYIFGVVFFAIFIGIFNGYYNSSKNFNIIDYVEVICWPILLFFIFGFALGFYGNMIKNYFSLKFNKRK